MEKVATVETKQVPVGDLVIDLSTSEHNVAQKMESMRSNGLVQPVTLWAIGNRIIDGFHRAEAAKRLGWPTITCYLVDCPEETFWDARIQSARQHHEVEDDRLAEWIAECWQSTQWHTMDAGADMAIEATKSLWEVARKLSRGDMFTHTHGDRGMQQHEQKRRAKVRESLTAGEGEILRWFEDKADRWDLTVYDIYERLVRRFPGFKPQELDDKALDSAAGAMGLSFEERQELGRKVRRDRGHTCQDIMDGTFEKDVTDFVREQGISGDWRSYAAARGSKRQDKEMEAEIVRLRKDQETVLFDAPKDAAYARRTVLRCLRAMQDASDLPGFAEMPDGPDVLTEVAVWAYETAKRYWPDSALARDELHSILAETVALEKSLEEQKQLRAAAERELAGTVERVGQLQGRLPQAMALSSTDF